jgi:hypothetical protein
VINKIKGGQILRCIVRANGSPEYLPNEYRGEAKDYYAARIKESKRQREAQFQLRKARVAELEREILRDLQLARMRARERKFTDSGLGRRRQNYLIPR